jgi:hypothetical protein
MQPNAGTAAKPAAPAAAPGFSVPFLREPAKLEVAFEHSFKSGTLKVWLDDDLVLEQPMESRVVKKVLGVRRRRGSVKKVVEVAPGDHVIRVQVQADGSQGSRTIRGNFDRGVTKHLAVDREPPQKDSLTGPENS